MNLTDRNLQIIFDSIDAHTIICDTTHVVFANEIVRRWFGIPSHVEVPLRIRDFVITESYLAIQQSIESFHQGEELATLRISAKHPTIGNVWLDATVKPANFLTDGDYWVVTFVPLRLLPTNYNPDEIEFEVLNSQPQTSGTMTTKISENYFVSNALEDALTSLSEVIPYDSTSIMLIEEDGLRLVAGRGFSENMNLMDYKIMGRSDTIYSSDVLYQNDFGIAYTIGDTATHQEWHEIDGIDHIRSWMGIELYYDHTAIGVLNIDSSEAYFFTKEHAKFALALSQQITLALVYSRLYHRFYNEYEEHRRLQRILVKNLVSTETMFTAQALLFSSERVADSLSDLVQIISSSMEKTEVIAIIFHQETHDLIHKVQTNILDIDLWQTFCDVIQMPNLQEDQAPQQTINLPADGRMRLADGRFIVATRVQKQSILMAVRNATDNPFDESDHELIVTIANQMSLALENEILDAQVQEHTQHLERMFDRSTSQLAVERKRLITILDSTAEGIFYMENFKLQYANPAFCQMVGYELDELYGQPLSFVRMASAFESAQNFDAMLENPLEVKPGRSETRLKHRDGTEFYASVRFSLVGQPGENPVRMVAIARDISQERKLYIQRARFIANAAHELRTPLSSLILRLHMLRRQPERIEAHLASLDKVTNYLKILVEELLTLSRFERGSITLEKSDGVIQEIIKQAVDEQLPFAQEQQVQLELKLPDDPITMMIDMTRIHQLITNLIINAINYSSENDVVQIVLTLEEDHIGNKNVILQVIDEGSGIDPELLPDDIFEPFARPSGGKRKETGMGLALVKEITHLHSGAVHVKSIRGEGATFRVSLPLN